MPASDSAQRSRSLGETRKGSPGETGGSQHRSFRDPPGEVDGRQVGVEVPHRPGHQPVAVVGPGPLVELVAHDVRHPGVGQDGGRLDDGRPDDLERRGPLVGGVERQQPAEVGRHPPGRRFPGRPGARHDFALPLPLERAPGGQEMFG
jgi:hypothetical protein